MSNLSPLNTIPSSQRRQPSTCDIAPVGSFTRKIIYFGGIKVSLMRIFEKCDVSDVLLLSLSQPELLVIGEEERLDRGAAGKNLTLIF